MLSIGALVLAALFTGAALYVLFVEHPARARLEPAAQLAQWKPAYLRGTLMQAPLAAVSGLAGIAVWWRWGDMLFLAGGALMLAAIAFTLIVMFPLNNRLKATPPESATAETAAMLSRWAVLHGVRTLIGLAATAVYAAALYRG